MIGITDQLTVEDEALMLAVRETAAVAMKVRVRACVRAIIFLFFIICRPVGISLISFVWLRIAFHLKLSSFIELNTFESLWMPINLYDD